MPHLNFVYFQSIIPEEYEYEEVFVCLFIRYFFAICTLRALPAIFRLFSYI